jgi:hypothetical protein
MEKKKHILLFITALLFAGQRAVVAGDARAPRAGSPGDAALFGPQAAKFKYSSQMVRAAEIAKARAKTDAAKKELPKPEAPKRSSSAFGWKPGIVTTTFWIGERPTKNNPTPNRASSWDSKWSQNYGGFDTPNPAKRVNYHPAGFVPRQNPFYVALPYNDVSHGAHKPEAARVIPWFRDAYRGPGISVLKGRWLAIRRNGKTAYAQWEDCGPFRTDHFDYVFGSSRPKPNLNKGAGLDVSPAVRDYLGMSDTDVTDWRFIDVSEVPSGPWAKLGNNNPLAKKQRIEKPALGDQGNRIASLR